MIIKISKIDYIKEEEKIKIPDTFTDSAGRSNAYKIAADWLYRRNNKVEEKRKPGPTRILPDELLMAIDVHSVDDLTNVSTELLVKKYIKEKTGCEAKSFRLSCEYFG